MKDQEVGQPGNLPQASADRTSPLPDAERDLFEQWYCADAYESVGLTITADRMRSIRDGDEYGPRDALNHKWEGWKARAALLLATGGKE